MSAWCALGSICLGEMSGVSVRPSSHWAFLMLCWLLVILCSLLVMFFLFMFHLCLIGLILWVAAGETTNLSAKMSAYTSTEVALLVLSPGLRSCCSGSRGMRVVECAGRALSG